jgi:IS1 family transposase
MKTYKIEIRKYIPETVGSKRRQEWVEYAYVEFVRGFIQTQTQAHDTLQIWANRFPGYRLIMYEQETIHKSKRVGDNYSIEG